MRYTEKVRIHSSWAINNIHMTKGIAIDRLYYVFDPLMITNALWPSLRKSLGVPVSPTVHLTQTSFPQIVAGYQPSTSLTSHIYSFEHSRGKLVLTAERRGLAGAA